MELRVIGDLAVLDEGERLLDGAPLPRRARQVLGVLAARHGKVQSKDAIADAVWGEDTLPRDHVAALEHYVSLIRRWAATSSTQGRSLVVTRPGGYLLDGRLVRLDLAEVQELGRAAEKQPAVSPERVRLREQVIDRVSALPFQDECYAEWAQPARAEVQEILIASLVEVAESCVAEAPERALTFARRASALDELAEHPYQLAIRAELALGRTGNALRTFERCRSLLADELGLTPSAQTEQLRREIMLRRGQVDRTPRVGPPRAVPAPAPAAMPDSDDEDRDPRTRTPVAAALRCIPSAPTTEPGGFPHPRRRATDPAPELSDDVRARTSRFLGRREELELLLAGGYDRTIHLLGPAGSGKSELLLEGARRAPRCVGVGRALTGSAALRLSWLQVAMRSLGAGTEVLDRLAAAAAEARALTVAELELVAEGVDRPTPTLLAVDDAERLDDLSSAELTWLRQRCPRLTIVLAYRCPGMLEGRLLGALGGSLVLRPAPLRAEEISDLGQSSLHVLTGGIPGLLTAATSAPHVGAAMAQHLATTRLEGMPESAGNILRHCAFVNAMTVPVLARLAGLPVDTVLRDLDRLIDAELLRADETGRVSHRSSLLRTALAEQVSPAHALHLTSLLTPQAV